MTLTYSVMMLHVLAFMVLNFIAKQEYNNLFLFTQKKEAPSIITNAELIDASIKIIFNQKLGELIVFAYPIAVISILVLLAINLHFLGISNTYTTIYFIICSAIILLHIVVPYYFTYLKYYEQSLLKNVPLAKWIDLATNNVSKKFLKKVETDIDISEDDLTFDAGDLKKYNLLVDKVRRLDSDISELSQNNFEKCLPFLNGRNLFFQNQEQTIFKEFYFNRFTEEKTVDISEIIFGISVMGMAMFRKTKLSELVNQRYIDNAMIFIVLYVIIWLSN